VSNTAKTQEWAERVGREAVELGFKVGTGHACFVSGGVSRVGMFCGAAEALAPDFRDRLTELACIAWVEDVAREVYVTGVEVNFSRLDSGKWRVSCFGRQADHVHPPSAPTLAEACIAAVRAMTGGE